MSKELELKFDVEDKDEEVKMEENQNVEQQPKEQQPVNNEEKLDQIMQQIDEEEKEIDALSEFANVPEEIEIRGKKIKIKGKVIRQSIQLHKDILALRRKLSELWKWIYEMMEQATDEDMFGSENFEEFLSKREEIDEMAAEIIFKIVNDDWENPEISKDWIMDNITIVDPEADNSGIKIIQMFARRCTPEAFFGALSGIRFL